jgi:uncharacterized protein YuzE
MKRDLIRIGPGVMNVKLEWNSDGVLAAYFRMSDKPVARTTETEIADVIVDLDRDGEIVGMELINPQTRPLGGIFKRLSKKYKGEGMKNFQKGHADRIKKLQALLST